MTGPEHYQAAEHALREAESWFGHYQEGGHDSDWHASESLYAEAQVHATLALAAVTATQPVHRAADNYEWAEACSVEEDRRRNGKPVRLP